MSTISAEHIWLLIGFILIFLEFIAPGLIFIFFGMGAITVGLLIFAGIPSSGSIPFFIFSGVSLGYLLLLRKFFKNWFTGRTLSERATGDDDDFIGSVAEVTSGFEKGQINHGRVMYRGALWDAQTDQKHSLAVGDKVKIVNRKNSLLIVDAM
ncbi:MAG: NfeD family protein [Gammaproteobacteria bacterium]|nr:NfeD family protein [Gammaproteobacteria bacterium]MCY4283626.1 NfeD family protein [Gammaproteobacteria bacterium]